MSFRRAYWLVFALMLTVYGAMVFWTLPAISEGAGGMMAFDLRPTGYTVAEARAFLDSLSDEARAIYLGPQRMLDMAYPALLGLVLGGALWSLVTYSMLRWVLIFVVGGSVLADYYENFLVAQMLVENETASDALISNASRATIAKSALAGAAMVALLIVLTKAGITKWRAQ
ncbi:MAG: hypothetical protein L3J36_11160 [Rhodobacteraceae bacterium]|nr:hypothetical protein [Paracoccaceae bacterium]